MTPTHSLGISMLGCGTVGLPLFRMLSQSGTGFQVRTVVVGNPEHEKYAELRNTGGVHLLSSAEYDASNGKAILGDAGTDLVVEVIGGSRNDQGIDPFQMTRDRLLAAIRAGKHIVTANKTALSHYGKALFEAADLAEVNLAFEASVAGSIPVIRLLKDHWRGQRIRKIVGILNGTCNYVLTKMPAFREAQAPMPESDRLGKQRTRADYASEKNGAMHWALEHAQVNGLAEADPSFDVDGHDAAQKLSILASIAFGTFIAPTEENIPRSSILAVTLEDIELANGLGYVIKPLSVAERTGDRIELRVHPCLLPKKHPLANVEGAYNAVFLEGEKQAGVTEGFGEQLYYGQGAGGDATAAALYSDVAEVAERIRRNQVTNPQYYRQTNSFKIVSGEDQSAPGYIKSTSQDIPGVFMNKTRILYGEKESERINIHQIYNLHELRKDNLVPDVITIWPTAYRHVRRALERFVEEGVAQEAPLFLRIEE